MPEEIKYAGINTLSHFKEFNDETYAPKEHLHTTGDIEDYVAPVQADWNESDETALSFVKNKPFYTIPAEAVTLVENHSSTFSQPNDDVIYYSADSKISLNQTFIEGHSYTVIWDSTIYEHITCFTQGDGYVFVIGAKTEAFYGAEEMDSWTYPFSLYQIPAYGTNNVSIDTCIEGSHTVTLIDEGEEVVNQLDEKFIPDTIARVADVDTKIANLPFATDIEIDSIFS